MHVVRLSHISIICIMSSASLYVPMCAHALANWPHSCVCMHATYIHTHTQTYIHNTHTHTHTQASIHLRFQASRGGVGAPVSPAYRSEVHALVFEKLAVGIRTHISFPPPWYTFGRAMLPFIRVGAEGFQCLGSYPLDNSTGACWVQPFDTYYIKLHVEPLVGTGIDLACNRWQWSEGRRFCLEVCGKWYQEPSAPGRADVHGEEQQQRCCDFAAYANNLMRSGRYIGLSCLPEGEFVLTVHFYDYYSVYTAQHQVCMHACMHARVGLSRRLGRTPPCGDGRRSS